MSDNIYHGFVIGLLTGGLITLAITNLSKKSSKLQFENLAQDLSKAQVLKMRKKMFCDAQSISYENTSPLMIVKGSFQYLLDSNGEWFLDTRNNVAHIGHQNASWANAVSRQLLQTNSNTRYLHPYPVLLAKYLLAKMPKKLSKVFFVNSGSEANDLALRLAQSRRKGSMIVSSRAYHGNTRSVINISPYKFDGKGGNGKPIDVEVLSCPDQYRNNRSMEELLDEVKGCCEKIENSGERLSGFIIESGMSVAGVILPPPGYLKSVYNIIRAYKGICIADEVQVGFGRMGEYYWGFEQQGVEPDIVTVAKPFGNGFPLAAVVCTEEIAQSFVNGMEYFNTFGGNPVACAAGLAVMEIIERDKLQENAREVGEILIKELKMLMDSEDGSLVGDIRGLGLFIGIEFVRDKHTKIPAKEEVSYIASEMLQKFRILTSCDGESYNVLVMKPPMTFSSEDAKYFVNSLRTVLREIRKIDLQSIKLTPT